MGITVKIPIYYDYIQTKHESLNTCNDLQCLCKHRATLDHQTENNETKLVGMPFVKQGNSAVPGTCRKMYTSCCAESINNSVF